MPDITMCRGENCEKRETCYRYKAKPDYWQSYFTETPQGECNHYWKMNDVKTSNKRRNKNVTR